MSASATGRAGNHEADQSRGHKGRQKVSCPRCRGTGLIQRRKGVFVETTKCSCGAFHITDKMIDALYNAIYHP